MKLTMAQALRTIVDACSNGITPKELDRAYNLPQGAGSRIMRKLAEKKWVIRCQHRWSRERSGVWIATGKHREADMYDRENGEHVLHMISLAGDQGRTVKELAEEIGQRESAIKRHIENLMESRKVVSIANQDRSRGRAGANVWFLPGIKPAPYRTWSMLAHNILDMIQKEGADGLTIPEINERSGIAYNKTQKSVKELEAAGKVRFEVNTNTSRGRAGTKIWITL